MKSVVVIFIMLLMIGGCRGKTGRQQYEELVKSEMASHKKVDSIFLGIYLGMPQKDFFKHCWEMNKKSVLFDGRDGMGNMYVLYQIKKDLKYPASMNFYPDFANDVIAKMKVNVEYNGWAPWNKHLGADSLLPDVLSMCNNWYSGNAFIKLADEKNKTEYVKVDGNRKISVRKGDDVIVKIEIVDLLTEHTNQD